MTTKKSNGEMWIAVICLSVSLGILGLGTTLPRGSKAGGLNLCESSAGERGYLSGIVTSVTKKNGDLLVNLTEGTQGCGGLLMADYNAKGKLLPGNRVKVKVKVLEEGMYQLVSNDILIDPTVVDTHGGTETPEKIEILIRQRPEFSTGDTYALFPINVKGEMLNLKIDKKIAEEIQYNRPVFVYYYESTKVVSGLEYH
ncbi:MAG: hypothetical protein V7L21_35815 [Nostoc sp.]|uniref:hypothetical protein n=1 Tax=Nostoc sp. TaxID=1180 RepID=UPI002FF50B17